MKRLFALILVVCSVGLAQVAPTPTLFVQPTTAATCQMLVSVIPIMQSCQPHIMMVAGPLPAGSAVRFQGTYVETGTGTTKYINQLAELQNMGGSLYAIYWLYPGVDFTAYSFTASTLLPGGVIELGR